MKSLVFLFFLLSATPSFSQPQDTLRPHYSDSLKTILKHIATIKDYRVIEYSIPTTKAESRIYFSCDYEKEFSAPFRLLEQKVVRSAISGNTKLLKAYLQMSEFVDTYFADDYVDEVDKMAKKNIVTFCNVLADCDPEKIKNLSEIKLEYCK